MSTVATTQNTDATRAGEYLVLFTSVTGAVKHRAVHGRNLQEVIDKVEPDHVEGMRIDICERGNIMQPRWTKMGDGTVTQN